MDVEDLRHLSTMLSTMASEKQKAKVSKLEIIQQYLSFILGTTKSVMINSKRCSYFRGSLILYVDGTVDSVLNREVTLFRGL